MRPISSYKIWIKDNDWFNEECKQANLAKQEASTWNNYANLRNATQETCVVAENTLIGTTNSYKQWSILKTTLFGVDVAEPPLLWTRWISYTFR